MNGERFIFEFGMVSWFDMAGVGKVETSVSDLEEYRRKGEHANDRRQILARAGNGEMEDTKGDKVCHAA